ncbi:hypothetical protein [Isoptericola sp. b408]|uniref:hypothetical protein n=1 Tax=Isoptericola sp. b408 TaxID=3064653 RepID=UPI00271334F2|nr:hypothetical protein [Isoptericola sp. b408]MDO8151318.1 hypothetical protein [Isoptericola sp. b408]
MTSSEMPTRSLNGSAPSPSPTESPSPSPSSGAVAGSSGAEALDALLWFGLIAIIVGCAIYVLVVWGNKAKGITFIRLYALMVVAVLAAILAITNVVNESTAAAFALLGTIAGYLAGKRDETKTTTTPPAPASGSSPPGGASITTEADF